MSHFHVEFRVASLVVLSSIPESRYFLISLQIFQILRLIDRWMPSERKVKVDKHI